MPLTSLKKASSNFCNTLSMSKSHWTFLLYMYLIMYLFMYTFIYKMYVIHLDESISLVACSCCSPAFFFLPKPCHASKDGMWPQLKCIYSTVRITEPSDRRGFSYNESKKYPEWNLTHKINWEKGSTFNITRRMVGKFHELININNK